MREFVGNLQFQDEFGWTCRIEGVFIEKHEVMHVLQQAKPRCETCRYWHGPQKSRDGREQCTQPTISPEQMDEFMTLPDFGCVLWEKKV